MNDELAQLWELWGQNQNQDAIFVASRASLPDRRPVDGQMGNRA